ncbi:hypothetical protein [Streptomyces sp.]|uniref:hypothetical protein n=1 Tax=Streptomyces sp. TaxID=1931 RepID=UPI002F422F24
MTHHDDFPSTPDEGSAHPPGPDPYGAHPYGHPQAPDPAYGGGYGPGPGYGGEYGTGPEQGYGQAGVHGYGAYGAGEPRGHDGGMYGGGRDGGTYVPEPLSGQPPLEGEPGAAFGAPSAGDAWATGHGAATDGAAAYGAPVGAGEWGPAPTAAGPWAEHGGADGFVYGTPPVQAGADGFVYGSPPVQGSADGFAYGTPPVQAGADGFAYGNPPAQEWSQPHAYAEPQSQQQPQPGAYAPGVGAPQPYPRPAADGEHTAVLPVVEDAAPPDRTGSPIIPPGIQPAGITAALGLLLAGGAALPAWKPGLTVFLVVLQAVTAAGWFRLNGMWPARQGILLAFLSGVTADIAVLAVDGDHGPAALLGTLGIWLLLVLVLQLRHHGSADERLSSLTATSASTLLTVVAAGYLAAATSSAGTDPVVVGAIAVAAATLVRALPLPGGEPVSVLLALAAAALTGLATGSATGLGGGSVGGAALLAAACGACALVGLRVASYDFPSRFVHFTAGVALPLTAAAPVVYVLGVALA